MNRRGRHESRTNKTEKEKPIGRVSGREGKRRKGRGKTNPLRTAGTASSPKDLETYFFKTAQRAEMTGGMSEREAKTWGEKN